MPTFTRVLAAVVRRDETYLIARRPRHKRHGGLWEFPGGKLEPLEDHLSAARRELAEELGIEVLNVGKVLFRQLDPGSEFLIEFRRGGRSRGALRAGARVPGLG